MPKTSVSRRERGSRGRGAAEVVGLVPAAGRATRLGPLPCSKEILPLPARDGAGAGGGTAVVRPVIAHLLDCYALAGIARAFVVLRSGKWDVPRTLCDRGTPVELAWVVVGETPGPVHSLARAAPFVRDSVVALGFPDILFAPKQAFAVVLEQLLGGDADVVLGLFPTSQAEKTDMVAVEPSGGATLVRDIVIKQPDRGLRYTWSIAAWRPRFTDLLVEAAAASPQDPLDVGDVLRVAIARGLRIEGACFEDGEYLDVGTPEDLLRAMARRW